jgi:hypothetical protein
MKQKAIEKIRENQKKESKISKLKELQVHYIWSKK